MWGVTNYLTTNHWTGLDWTGILKFVLWHAIAMSNYLRTSVYRVPGMHCNCSTIRAGYQLRSYTSEKTAVFNNSC